MGQSIPFFFAHTVSLSYMDYIHRFGEKQSSNCLKFTEISDLLLFSPELKNHSYACDRIHIIDIFSIKN